MSGLCDQPNPFLEVFNVREVCMRSCGVCNRYVCMQIAFYLFNFFHTAVKGPNLEESIRQLCHKNCEKALFILFTYIMLLFMVYENL